MPDTSDIAKIAKNIGIARDLWEGFPEDFDVKKDGGNPVLHKNILHLQSEVSEFYMALNRERDLDHAREELVDIIMIALGIGSMLGIELNNQDFAKVVVKNVERINMLGK